MFKNFFYIIWKYLGIRQIEKSLSILILNEEYKKTKYQKEKILIKSGFKIFSQQDEDGIIEEIFKRIGTKNKKFLEVGVETGAECNTTYLLLNNWSGAWVESNNKYETKIKNNFNKFIERKNLKIVFKKVNPDNINDVISDLFKKDEDIDLLSIDIGVHTFHTLKEIEYIKPRVVVAEYNSKYGPSMIWESEYNKNAEWDGSDNFGASLKSFQKMMENKKYKLVSCNITGANAFFIREDLINDLFENNYESENHFVEGKNWLKLAFEKDYKSKFN